MGSPQGDMHMVAARLGFERGMVGTGWATSYPDCMDRLRKHYSHLVICTKVDNYHDDNPIQPILITNADHNYPLAMTCDRFDFSRLKINQSLL